MTLWSETVTNAKTIHSAVAATLCRRTPKSPNSHFSVNYQKRPSKLNFSVVEVDDQPSGGVLAFTARTTRRPGYACQTRPKLNDAEPQPKEYLAANSRE